MKVDPLEGALRDLDDRNRGLIYDARRFEAALKSAVRAVLPGRQQKANLDPLLQKARKAFIRTLRRRGKK